MKDKITKTTLGDIFDREESILERRARERREAAKAHDETPEGKAEAEAREEARAKRMADWEALDEAAPDDEDDDEDDLDAKTEEA